MDKQKFSFLRLSIYFIFVSLFLFVSGSTGQYLISNYGIDRQIGMLIQGVIFTGLTLAVLYYLKKKNRGLFVSIGLKGVKSTSKLIVGFSLPIILLLSGIFTAYLLGGIENVRLNLTTSVIIAVLINTVTAFLYEAFPEEISLRGLIFEELRKKFRFNIALLLQPLIFICVPIMSMAMSSIILGQQFILTIDYVLLLFVFEIALQLYRRYTGTLWMSIFFHVVYLEVVRYISSGGMYDPNAALLEFDEAFGGFMMLYQSFLFMVIFSTIILAILLFIDKKKNDKTTHKM